jgi:hypothetical protein
MNALIWTNPEAADWLFLAAAIVAFADWLLSFVNDSPLSRALLTVSIVLIALGLLAQ